MATMWVPKLFFPRSEDGSALEYVPFWKYKGVGNA
jgi:hypothetical protein